MSLFNIEPTVNFVDILGYEGIYKINKQGQVLRVGGSVITKNGHTQRYPEKLLRPYKGQVYLSKGGHVTTFRVCDLVAQAYISEYRLGMKATIKLVDMVRSEVYLEKLNTRKTIVYNLDFIKVVYLSCIKGMMVICIVAFPSKVS